MSIRYSKDSLNMSINIKQFRLYILRPALKNVGLYSLSAEQLLLGTCATESQMGYYVRQVIGPAKGPYQMEPFTHDDIWKTYLNSRNDIVNKIMFACNFMNKPTSDELVYNFMYATIMARIRYLRVPEKLPFINDIEAQAAYYKKYYNTPKGKATEQDYIDAYYHYIKEKFHEI